MQGPREPWAAWFLEATLCLPGCRPQMHLLPQETNLWEEVEEGWGPRKAPQGWPPQPCVPLSPRMKSPLLPPQDAMQAEGSIPHQGSGTLASAEGGRQRCRHANTGNPDFKKSQWSVRPGVDGCLEKPHYPNPAGTFPTLSPCLALSPSAQSWGAPKAGASLPTSESHFGDPVAAASQL